MKKVLQFKSLKLNKKIALAAALAITSAILVGNSVTLAVGVGVGTGYVSERAAFAGELNNVLLPVFPELTYKPVPKSLLAAKTLEQDESLFVKKGILAQVKSEGKWGVVGTDGNVTLKPTYKKLDPAYDGNFYVGDNKKDIFLVDQTGHRLTSEEIEDLRLASKAKMAELNKAISEAEGGQEPLRQLSTFKVDKLIGFEDENQNVVIPAQFKDVYTDFSEGLAFVKTKDNKKVAINEEGQVVFEAPYDELFAYNDGLAEYRRKVSGFNFGSLLGFVAGGYISHGGWGYAGGIGGGFTYDGIKRGYLDKTGKVVIDSKLDAVYPITPFGTAIRDKGQAGFVGRDGKFIIPLGNYEIGTMDIYQGVISLKNKDADKFGVFSVVDGKKVIDFTYDSIDFIGNGRLIACQGDVKYLVNMINGKTITAFTKDTTIEAFGAEKVTWVHEGDKNYNIIDLDGNVLFDAKSLNLEKVGSFTSGRSAARVNGKWGILDQSGKWVVQPTYDEIQML